MSYLLKLHPKKQLISLLLLFFIVASLNPSYSLFLGLLVLCVGFTVISDLVFTYIKKKTFFIPYSATITGLIITLIIDPTASWFQIFVICAAAMAMKNFLRVGGRHIFNPTAFGLLFGWLAFGLYPSWWAPTLYTPGAFSIPNAIVLLSVAILGFVSCFRFKRYYSVISFLFAFTALSILLSPSPTPSIIPRIILNPGILFYTFVMLVEPMTSPVKKEKQIMYGLFVGIAYVLLVFGTGKNLLPSNLPDSSLAALVIGNILFFKFR